MRKEHQRLLEKATDWMERAVEFTGNGELARKLAPDAFELVEKEMQRIVEIDKLLEKLEASLEKVREGA